MNNQQNQTLPEAPEGHVWIIVTEANDRLLHLAITEGAKTLCGRVFDAYDTFAEALPTDKDAPHTTVCQACLDHFP
jgi:hypothetical protein